MSATQAAPMPAAMKRRLRVAESAQGYRVVTTIEGEDSRDVLAALKIRATERVLIKLIVVLGGLITSAIVILSKLGLL